MASYADIVRNYALNTGYYTGSRDSRMFYEGDILYSYGHHFPLAIRLGDEKDRLGRKPTPEQEKQVWGTPRGLFLKNGDKYSNTTSGHQSHTQSNCFGPTVSFSALHAAGFPVYNYPQSIKRHVLVNFVEDDSFSCFREKETGQLYRTFLKGGDPSKITRPRQGMFMPSFDAVDVLGIPDHKREIWTAGVWHTLGGALLKWGGSQYLCGMDDDSYFASKLTRRHRTVADAFKGLKPKPVKQAEKDGKEIVRQGEWFFINTGMSDRDMAAMAGCRVKDLNGQRLYPGCKRRAKEQALPKSSDSSNPHICRQLMYGRQLYAKGRVRHPEHPMARLGKVWHRVYKNTEEISFSVGGRFD